MTASFFKQSEPWAYEYYKPEQVVLGKTMEQHLRFAVCYWHNFVWPGLDPFGGDTFQRPWHAAGGDALKQAEHKADVMFELLRLVDAPYFTFHDRDMAPEGATLAESNRNVRHIGEIFASEDARTAAASCCGERPTCSAIAASCPALPPTRIPRSSPMPRPRCTTSSR